MRVMRAHCDGSQVETLVETGQGDKDAQDQSRWCVGITVGAKLGKIYWTQKGPDIGEQGRIWRASIELPKGESAANLFKQKLYGQLDQLLPPDVIIASSSSGLTMSGMQKGAAVHPERCVIAHPFNPPHLIPPVEIVGGAKTSEDTIRRASEFLQVYRTAYGCASTRKCRATLPTRCRPPWRARFITALPRES
jgi:3-hydroxyacyl-CoA dehydrogenase, NAD binding domain